MEDILHKTKRVLLLRNCSPKTCKAYLLYIKEYIIFSKKAGIKNKQEAIEDFLEKITEQNLQKLKYLTEKCKISLSDNLKTKVIINNFYDNQNLEVSITREDLNLICKDLISLMIKPINELLGICGIDKCLIDQVVMVGGMTKMPIIVNNIELYFQKEKTY